MNLKNKSYAFAIFFSCLCIFFCMQQQGIQYSFGVLSTSAVIQILSCFAIFNNNQQPYSAFKIFYIFCLFFFGIAPYAQFVNSSSFWGAQSLGEDDYILMNCLVIVIMILMWYLYNLFYSLRLSKSLVSLATKDYELNSQIKIAKGVLLIIISFISFLSVLYANNFSILSMLVRGGELKELSVEGNMTNLLILRFLMPISVVCFIVYYLSEKRSLIILFFLLILMLITACPTGISRNTTAGLYIPVLLTCFAIFKRRNFFILSFLFAILILFPLLNQFRTFNSDDGLSFTPDFSMFIEGHFDSYPNFALIINSEIVTYGIQLLGVLFFWIPRSIWPGKPISSGIFLSEKANLNFENISVNYFAEGYLNFGFVGLFIFLVILAFTLARIDKIYWRYTVQYKSNFFNVIYLICLGMLFFVLRGDLMSSFAYTLGMLFSSIFVFKFVKK